MVIKAENVKEYIDQVPEDRKKALQNIRKVLKANLPKGFKECISYNMPSFVVPHSLYPDGYHCDPKVALPFVSFASQKNFIALYHSGIYADKDVHDWWVNEYPKHSKTKLDMGKSCIRFKNPDKIPLELIGELATKFTPEKWIEIYERNIKRK